MRYLLLIYNDEKARAEMGTQEQEFPAWDDYGKWLVDKGWMRGGEALQPTVQATTVRAPGGTPVATDGPFAETKEQLGGFYLLEVDYLDDAIEAAGRCPAAAYGSIELRPIMEYPAP